MGRPKRGLTEIEKQYIRENYRTSTYREISDELGFKSTFTVQCFCNKNKLIKFERALVLTEEQKEFVRNNLHLTEKEISSRLDVPFFLIPKLKREEKLSKARVKKVNLSDIFDVNEVECWIA